MWDVGVSMRKETGPATPLRVESPGPTEKRQGEEKRPFPVMSKRQRGRRQCLEDRQPICMIERVYL